MSSAARHSAMARHPALNRMPRDFIGLGALCSLTIPNTILKGEAT
jgi:hypothetical protein